ncbi:hypothetical protein P8631_14840, partial [Guyparkeria sp. 1SP6A2]|nr:hypothetical protein [Guyparkeria sp. 1SP6A2]
PFGDFEPQYALQEGSELLLERATNSDDGDNASYTVTFVDMLNGGFAYQLERDGEVVEVNDFDPRTGVQYQGLTINIKGSITAGDSITLNPRKTFTVFDSFKKAIEYSKGS